MRVIAGSRRGMLLKAPEGMNTRPTTDRIKETLFNMIAFDLSDALFLDLFAGSGQMGIEAISRGAKEAVFIEQGADAFRVLSDNVKKAAFENQSMLLKDDIYVGLNKIKNHKPFDFVFMDPPYNKDFEKEVLSVMRDYPCVDLYTTFIVEASLGTDMSYAGDLGYTIEKVKTYKTNKHIFLKKA